MGISGKRVLGIVNRRVAGALGKQDLDDLKHLSGDETNSRRGNKYLTIITDRKAKKVVGVAVGKDRRAFDNAFIDMAIRGAYREDVRYYRHVQILNCRRSRHHATSRNNL